MAESTVEEKMLSYEELLIKACTVVAGYVQPVSIPTSEHEAAQFLDSLDAVTEGLLLDWCDDVLDTHESGSSLTAKIGRAHV